MWFPWALDMPRKGSSLLLVQTAGAVREVCHRRREGVWDGSPSMKGMPIVGDGRDEPAEKPLSTCG
jgi:hypothetical protein